MTLPLLRELRCETAEVIKAVGAEFPRALGAWSSSVRGLFAQLSATFGERDVEVTGGASPADAATSFVWGAEPRRSDPRHVFVTAVRDENGAPITTTAPVSVNWFYDGVSVRVTQIFGLANGTKYTLRLAILGGL